MFKARLILIALLLCPASACAADVQPLLATYCHSCHGDAKAKGKLNLKAIAGEADVLKSGRIWRESLLRVRGLEMPPDDAKQPTPAERDAIVKWIEGNLSRIAAATPQSAGRVTVRRLNRLEYRNTITDLLGIEFNPLTFDPTRDFPADGAGYGFDNIGDVLSTSALHLEQYLSAAEKILDQAIVTEGLDGPRTWRFERKQLRVGGVGVAGDIKPGGPLTPRAWYADLDVRQTGQYLVRAEIVNQSDNRKLAQMAYMLDGQNPQKFTLTRDGKTVRVERKLHLKVKGAQQVGVAYLHEQNKPAFEPADAANGGFDVNWMEVVGPVDVSPDKLPDSHKRVFVARPGKQPGGETLNPADAAEKVIAHFASLAFRRPATADEVGKYRKLFDVAFTEGTTFESAMRAPLSAILVSPHFLYRIEEDRPAETPAGDYPLNGYELASRLSYFIWSSTPDAELLRLAGEGKLTDDAVLEQQVRRMLADPKSDRLAPAFATQWLQIRGIESLPQPDAKKFGKLGTALKDAMLAEPVMLFQHVLRNDRPLTELLNADYTFINEELAKQYKIEGIKGKEMRKVSLADARRGGILTMAGVLAVTSHPDRTSPVKRGKWVLDAILNASPPPPPPEVGPLAEEKPDPTGKAKQHSLRERLEIHRAAATCAACHKRMDPLGFALENYDAVGRWRDKDDKLNIDASATLPDGRTTNGPVELKKLLVAERDAFAGCLAEKMLTFALGRGVEEFDRPTLARITAATAADDYKLSRLVIEIAKSHPFRYRQAVGRALPAE